ncbi:restriction endonuclease subunit S [bacterium]|nr:restriction endonuclease subunit S [bacterium]
MKLEHFCHINPTEQLCKNVEYDFVEMADIVPGEKYVFSKSKKRFNGSFSKFSNKDTLMAKITPCLENGKISQFIGSDKAFGSTEFNIFREKKDISDNDYLYYLISSPLVKEPAIKSMSGATGRQRTNLDKIKQIEVPDISIKTQRKIAKFLTNYDDLIENNNRRIKILEEMAQKIYKEWFVDFKFPGHETTTFKDSPLGKIPNDWEVKLFSEYFDIQNGFAFKSKDYSNNGVKIIRTKDFASTKYINITDPIFLPNQLKSKYETYMLQEYDFLLIMVGASIGKYGIVLKKDMPSLQNQNMWALRPKNNYIYLRNYSIFMFENLIKKVLSFATGAAREFFRKEHFNNQRIIVPDSCVLNLFNQITNDILNEISNLYTKNENLKQTRDILLPRLISGEIDVKNMEVL